MTSNYRLIGAKPNYSLVSLWIWCFLLHKQNFIEAIRQNQKKDYNKPSRRKNYLQEEYNQMKMMKVCGYVARANLLKLSNVKLISPYKRRSVVNHW